MATKPDVVGIGYHASFPYAGDPFYLANPAEQNYRGFYYEVNRTPAMFIDGPPQLQQYNNSDFEGRYVLRNAIPSPMAIEMDRDYDSDLRTGLVHLRLIAEQAIPGDKRLRVAVVENHVPYNAWNGINVHEHVFRKFLPDTTGTVLNFTAPYPDTATVTLPYTLAPDWGDVNCELVAFVQEQGSREMIQGAKIKAFQPGVGIDDSAESSAPARTRITSISPNPFRAETQIRLDSTGGAMRLTVHDTAGRLVRVLVDGSLPAGAQAMRWDGRDETGRELGSGIYFMRLSPAGASPEAVKVLRLR
jgi:outer membrane protein Omp28/flagellar hook capping protein FlgD